MRKILVLIGVAALTVSLFSPAEAATKRFSISLNPTPSGTQEKYNDTSLDLTSPTTAKRQTIIRGKVKGGSVAGKRVRIYATNMSTQARQRRSLGYARINSKGYFSKKFAPDKGYGGVYRIEIVKKAGGGRQGRTKVFNIRVFEFVSMTHFYRADVSTPGLATRADYENGGPGRADQWSISYALQGPGTAVFDIRGYRCFQFNLKLGLSYEFSQSPGAYSVTQPVRGTLMAASKRLGDSFDEPTKTQAKSIRADQPFRVTVTGDQGTRFILGNAKALCTVPTKVARAPY